jgi:hypothetical protein
MVTRRAMVSESSGIDDQSFLMSFSAAELASASDALSYGVTKLRTVSPGTILSPEVLGEMAARQCPGFRS